MNIETSLTTATHIHKADRDLCRIEPRGPFNPSHLPTELRKECESYERQFNYHWGELQKLVHAGRPAIEVALGEWLEATYYHAATDLLSDPNWENYYPAIVIADKPYRTLLESQEADEATQRYIATRLLTGLLSKKEQEKLLKQAQRLVCTLDPRDEDFFTPETLQECLQSEGLITDQAINKQLGRKHYIKATKADRREALAQRWERRNERLKLEWSFERGEWEEYETEALEAFTYLAFSTFTQSQPGYVQEQFNRGIWAVLQRAENEVGLSDYYLDPRDEDTWLGIRDLVRATKELDLDSIHYDHQKDTHTGQKWIREVGMPALYGGKAEWWVEVNDLVNERETPEGKLEVLLTKQNRTPLEEVNLCKSLWIARSRNTEARELVYRKYTNRLKEMISHEK